MILKFCYQACCQLDAAALFESQQCVLGMPERPKFFNGPVFLEKQSPVFGLLRFFSFFCLKVRWKFRSQVCMQTRNQSREDCFRLHRSERKSNLICNNLLDKTRQRKKKGDFCVFFGYIKHSEEHNITLRLIGKKEIILKISNQWEKTPTSIYLN